MFVPTTMTELLMNQEKNYIVISDTENIRDFFQYIKIPNVIYHHYEFQPHRDGWLSFIKRKNELLQFVSQYEIGSVVFFHSECGDMANWLLRKLSKNISIKYCKVYDTLPAPHAPLSLRKIKILLTQRVLWGEKMDILYDAYAFPSLPKSFFEEIHAETITMSVDRVLNNEYLKDILNDYDIKGNIVLLTGTVIKDKIYTEEEYIPFIDELIEEIGLDNIVSKCHPRYKDLYGQEKKLKQVPSFLPGNVLLDCFDTYIGVESTLLVEAALAGKKAISILDWLKPDENFRKTIHEYFENRLGNKGIICFPQSMNELRDLIALKEKSKYIKKYEREINFKYKRI